MFLLRLTAFAAATVAIAQSQEVPSPPTFRTSVELVLVPVVVRNDRGDAVGTLRREDFRLLDDGKQRNISSFVVEASGAGRLADRGGPGGEPAPLLSPSIPEHFVAYVFDDLHLGLADLTHGRTALDRHLARTDLQDTRTAVVSTSGVGATSFTADRSMLRAVAARVQPGATTHTGLECPDISYYMADQIENKRDGRALAAAANQVGRCAGPVLPAAAMQIAKTEAARVVRVESAKTTATLNALKGLIDRMARMPGSRTIVVLSAGFHLTHERAAFSELLVQAGRSRVTINAINAHGVHGYGIDASRQQALNSWTVAGLRYSADSLTTMAEHTGGVYRGNSNDLEGELRRIAERPEFVYVLGFVPDANAAPGQSHKLDVEVARNRGLTLQLRRAYYTSPGRTDSTAGAYKLRRALFSAGESQDLPISISAAPVATGSGPAKLRVSVNVDVAGLRFTRTGDRHRNLLTMVYALFDRDGNCIGEVTRRADMKLEDSALATLLARGMQLGAEFDVARGSYLARVAVLEEESGRIGTAGQLVPFSE